MKQISKEVLVDAGEYIVDQFSEFSDSRWLEGWILGFTDLAHGYSNDEVVKDKLFELLRLLRSSMYSM